MIIYIVDAQTEHQLYSINSPLSLTPRYSWNSAKVNVKYQSINQLYLCLCCYWLYDTW